MSKFRWIVGLGILGLAPSLAGADDHKGSGQSRFETLDSNGDGVVSYAEFQEAGRDVLVDIDTDGDGMLSLDEFLEARPPRPRGFGNRGPRPGADEDDGGAPPVVDEEQRQQRQEERVARMTERFDAMDEDGDGMLTADEFQAANFDRLDRDANGELTADELRRPGRGGKGGKGGRRGRGGPGGQFGGQSPQN